ncbi:hypothetical protein GCM10011360_12730 [Primorskyibacter flagellatus]|uniref:Phosphatidylglycerol lysyltransferase C-terminal domain-containing protein n=1 Tax=Primorskyibacter flagellatus TaxID=1387277 RepID=A0A917EDH3_9RHOB|nr:phosphatidylglycerol lysyltransferase domain-containing protein [Primorskyibacter flagellatus]GGE25743.1 hypothetical protein GCM10011360_12730 [Primorskyibacter flagellatus]
MTRNSPPRAAVLRAAASRRLVKSGLPLIVGAICIWLLSGQIRGLDFHAVAEVVRTTSISQWAGAAVATALSFWAIGTYDAVMHRHLRTGVPADVARMTGAGSIALAQVLGLGVVTGALARWRMLAGTTPAMAATVTGAVSVSFLASWGLITVALCALLPGVALPPLLAFAVLAALIGLATLVVLRPVLRVGQFSVRMPSLRTLLSMLVLTAVDLTAAAAALHILMPGSLSVGYTTLLPIFALALGAGLFSSTPGGAGPFELTLLALLPAVGQEPLLGAVLAWRVIYYAVPALIAVIPLAFPFRFAPAAPDRAAARSRDLPHAPRAECGVARQNRALSLDSGTGSAAVVETGQCLALLFDPMSGTPADTVRALSRAARERMLVPAIYKCSARTALAARRAGWRVMRVADDAVIDLSGHSLEGSGARQLRRKLRQAEKAGVQVTQETASAPLMNELARIDALWVAEHGGARGFSMGRFDRDYLLHQRIFVARIAGRAVAFVTLHETSRDLALDIMRHEADVPDGTMHSLVVAAIAAAGAEGRSRMTLAAMPARPARDGRITARLRARIAARTGGNGLIRFKDSFGPRRAPLYIAAPDMASLVLAGADIARSIRGS